MVTIMHRKWHKGLVIPYGCENLPFQYYKKKTFHSGGKTNGKQQMREVDIIYVIYSQLEHNTIRLTKLFQFTLHSKAGNFKHNFESDSKRCGVGDILWIKNKIRWICINQIMFFFLSFFSSSSFFFFFFFVSSSSLFLFLLLNREFYFSGIFRISIQNRKFWITL